jgi:sugar phosphate isomerase/epimerase
MKLAFTTLACPAWTIEQAAQNGRAAGYEGIELRLLDGEVVLPTLPAAERRRVRAACAAEDLALICLDTSVRIAQPDQAAREQQLQDGLAMLEMAAELGAPVVRVFAGPPEGAALADAVAGAVACLTPLAERAEALGVVVALETHDAFCDSHIVAQVLDQVPGPGAGALWDLLHPFRIGEPYAETLGRLRDRLAHVHIKDGRPPAGGGSNWDLKLLGEGIVPTADIIAALRASGYNGWLAVEWEKKWHPELAEPEQALPQHIKELRAYLERSS